MHSVDTWGIPAHIDWHKSNIPPASFRRPHFHPVHGACAQPFGSLYMDISHVVTVYNKAACLPSVAKALLEQTGDHKRELIFVDDASTDHSLAIMQQLAREDERIRIIENTENLGPSIRLNQGAQIATGNWLHLIDADDVPPINACHVMLELLANHHADAVYGEWQKTDMPIESLVGKTMDSHPGFELSDHPLDLVLRSRCVRMVLICRRDIFLRAGGCDPRIFVQDESLPLRMASIAQRWLLVHAPVVLVPKTEGHMSDDKTQQHHDRFFAYLHALKELPNLTKDQNHRLYMRAVSSAWKHLRYYKIGVLGEPIFWQYFLSRLPWTRPNFGVLVKLRGMFLAVPNVRRIGVERVN